MHFELKTLYHRRIDKVRDAAHHRGQRAQAMCHQMQKVGVVHAPRANPGHAGQGTCFLCVTGDTNNERQSGRKIKQPTPERVAQRVKADWGQIRDRRGGRPGRHGLAKVFAWQVPAMAHAASGAWRSNSSQPMLLLPRHLTSVSATQRSQANSRWWCRERGEGVRLSTLAHGVTMMNDHWSEAF